MKQLLNRLGRSILRISLMVMLGMSLLWASLEVYEKNFAQDAIEEKVRAIYEEMWRQTGQIQDKLPLEIVRNSQINAYNDGKKIVIYTGLIDYAESWDEIALVLGHEIAHGTLYHLTMNVEETKIMVLEANADKMGAVYVMKAGYDVCEGREFFKRLLQNNGDYLGGDHPGFAYRYSELNIGCE